MIDIAKARALCAAATPGEWWHTHVYAGEEVIRYGEPPETLTSVRSFDDAAFIASARTLLPEALTELEQERIDSQTLGEAAEKNRVGWLTAEAERDALKAEVAVARERLGPGGYRILVEVATLRAENARLRKALGEISENYPLITQHRFAGTIAAEALAAPQTGGDDE